MAEPMLNAYAAAQAGWQAITAPDEAARAQAVAAALQIMASCEGEEKTNLYLALTQLPGAILHAAGVNPVEYLADAARITPL